MKKNLRKNVLIGVLLSVAVVAVLAGFLGGVKNLSNGRSEEDKARLEDVLRRSAVACYAAEGIYPPSVEYMEEHYGLQIDKENYAVSYNVIAENLMPDITVLEK